jgi:lysophospholipase L1-like esterase
MASIYMLGDSHSQALGPRMKTRLNALGHSVNFQAFPGRGTSAAQRLATIPSGQDAVILSLGGNDRGDQSAARKTLVDVVKLRNPGAKIVWFGPFAAPNSWVGPIHDQQADAQRSQVPHLGVVWVDTRPFSNTGHRADDVHFTAIGYSQIADAMKGRFLAALGGSGGGGGSMPSASTGVGVLVTVGAALAALWYILRD